MLTDWARKIAQGALIAFFVVWVVIGSWQSSHESASQHRTYEPTQTASDQGKQPKPFWEGMDAIAFFTLCLVLVGGVQLRFFYVQLRLIRESLIDAKIAADAAKDGARAARDSADTAKISMVASDRAYVHHNEFRWISHKNIGDGQIFWRIRPRWINSGNTPTRRLRVYVHYEPRDDELPKDYKFVPGKVEFVPTTIAPKGELESGHRDITGADLVAISRGEKHLYVWGTASYRDVFPGTSEHITKFCVYAANVSGDPLRHWHAKSNPLEIMFRTYGWHNCADEDCEGNR
jgi:hypothetical protein